MITTSSYFSCYSIGSNHIDVNSIFFFLGGGGGGGKCWQQVDCMRGIVLEIKKPENRDWGAVLSQTVGVFNLLHMPPVPFLFLYCP